MSAATEFYALMLAFAFLGLLIITLGWALMWAHETPRAAEFDAIDWSNEVWAELDREAS